MPLRGVSHRIVHRAGQRGTVWTEIRDSGERIICVAGGADYIERRVHDYLKREARKDLQKAATSYAQALGVRVRDLGSRNGTFLSDVRVGEVYLLKPTTLVCGDSALEFNPTEPEKVDVPDVAEFGPLVGTSAVMRGVFASLPATTRLPG